MSQEQATILSWIIDRQVLLLTVNPNTTQYEAFPDQQIVDYINSVTGTVDLIVQVPPIRNRRPSVKQMTSYKHQEHPRLGYILVVGLEMNPMSRFLMRMMTTIRQVRIRNFETVEDALSFLRNIRDTLL